MLDTVEGIADALAAIQVRRLCRSCHPCCRRVFVCRGGHFLEFHWLSLNLGCAVCMLCGRLSEGCKCVGSKTAFCSLPQPHGWTAWSTSGTYVCTALLSEY